MLRRRAHKTNASLLAACLIARLCLAWTPAQTRQPRRLAAKLDDDAYPPAPWSFSNARVMYQPTLVRASAARAVTPRDGLTLLSFLGWTLGGVTGQLVAEIVEGRAPSVELGPYRAGRFGWG